MIPYRIIVVVKFDHHVCVFECVFVPMYVHTHTHTITRAHTLSESDETVHTSEMREEEDDN